jgi:CspA family cold shock protein
MKGFVYWFNDNKGFGFLKSDKVKGEIFVHYTAIISDGFKTLSEGEDVTFDLIEGPKGYQACNVKKGIKNEN